MKTIVYVIIGFLILACTSKERDYGKLVIVETYPFYENEDNYFPHDYFVEVDMQEMLDTTLSVKKEKNHLKITNIFNNGFGGHQVEFTISKNLDITNVKYDYWTDVIDGSKIKYTVEKVILSMNANPFEYNQIEGYYTIQIREEYSAGEILKEEGINDTIIFNIFNGKFKVYSEQEKKNGRDWVISQNEIQMGIKDSLDIYYSPDKFATFSLGNDSLTQLLQQFEIERSETTQETRKFVLLEMVIDENGGAIPESMVIEEIKSGGLIRELKNCESLLSNWTPAIYKNKSVKSKVNLPIRIKD